MQTVPADRRTAVAIASCLAMAVAACDDDGDDARYFGACHANEYVAPDCVGIEAERLATSRLGNDFLSDVFAEVGLDGVYGWRVTFGDVNGDRFPDIVALNKGSYSEPGSALNGPARLMINRKAESGGRRFEDATEASGLLTSRIPGATRRAALVALADVDNDGDFDLLSGSYSAKPNGVDLVPQQNELFLNDGEGHFTMTAASAFSESWPLSTSAAVFLDYDKDGVLDLYLGAFMIDYPYLASYQDELYRGIGDGSFERVTDAVELTTDAAIGSRGALYAKPTYGAMACDWNDDGWPDILTSTYALGWNDLWRNNGGASFSNLGAQMAFAMDDVDNPAESDYRDGGNTFGADCGDYDNDGDLDVFNANTVHGDFPRSTADRSRILRNTGPAGDWVFERPPLEETGINRSLTGGGADGNFGNEGDHGASWLDFDNDGMLDLVIEASAYPASHAWLYHQTYGHTFVNVTPESGVRLDVVASNGHTIDDYDRDGDLDILIGSTRSSSQSPPGDVPQIHLLENVKGNQNNFLYVTLRGVTANRFGVGARVVVEAGCLRQMREISGGKGSFGAANPPYAHFGLGAMQRVDKLEVRWPTNPPIVQTFYNVDVNQFLEITEGSDALSCEPPAG